MKQMRYCVSFAMVAFHLTLPAEVVSIPFDFSKRPPYGYFENKWDHSGSGTVERIEYALKRPFRQKMAIRVTDASGQTFQDDVPPASETWVRHAKAMSARWPLHFGGAKDGVMHHPIRDFRVLVLGDGKGEVLVKDVKFHERLLPPEPAVTLFADMFKAEPPAELEVEIRAEKVAFGGGSLDVTWRDWDGNLVGARSLPCASVASGGTWRATLPYAKRPVGRNAMFCNATFRMVGRVIEVEGPSWAAPIPALPNSGIKEDLPWGTGIYLQRWGVNEKAFEKMGRLAAAAHSAGICWLREQIVWQQVEKVPGQLDFSKYDRIMDIVEKYGFRICMLFGALPRGHANTDADYPELYCEALRKAVRRYRGRIAAWEICNEPNLPWPMDERWKANYRRLLTMATKVVHEEDPAARTVGCSASGLGVGFVKSLADETFDDVSIHPYRRFADAREFLADLAEVRSAGHGRDIWITEIGWHSFFPGFPRRAGEVVSERSVSAHEFASLMARSHMVAAAASGVRAVFGYDFVDDGVLAAGRECHMGVVYDNVAPKPAYRALAKVFRHFRSGRPSVEIRADGLCVFRMGGRCAVWMEGEARRHVLVSRPAEVTNLMDEPCAAQSVGGKFLYATDDRHPIFFDGDPGEIVPVTEGWENVAQDCREVAPVHVVWSADFVAESGFSVEKRDGAEGRIAFADGALTIEKTNDAGLMIVRAKSFHAPTGMPLRLFADAQVSSGDYFHAQAALRAYGKNENLLPCWKLNARYFSMGGAEEMCAAVNSAPGTSYRKYTHYLVGADGLVTPVIVVAGTPSKSVWRNWTAEDLDAADAKWEGIYRAKTARDNSAERMDEAAFDRLIANDKIDHTARLEKVGGVTRLLIDGVVSVPTAYRSKGSFGDDALLETFAGGPVVSNGVRLVVKTVAMGGKDGTPRRYWTKDGFDVAGAVRDIKNALRLVPDALCVLGIQCNAYPDFTRVEHPDEVWRLEDGTVVRGTAGSCEAGYDDMGIADTNRWPWVSYASPSWRAAVKANICELLAELKRTGLSRRIVGVHLSGYHDGQFYSPFPDYSECAKAEYERFLKESHPIQYDYDSCSRILGFRAQEDFARAFKAALGKDAIAIRWCMGPFIGGQDLTEFAFSDALDIIVPQPTYETRRPGMAAEMKLPFSSFDLHGKMYWNELDLRTYGALESWAKPGVVATKGLGQSDDLAMWRTVSRKFVGMMLAHGSGFWLYDMGGGWFSPPEIADDFGEALRVVKAEVARAPSAWRPDVALVADEAGLRVPVGGAKSPFSTQILRRQLAPLAASGVPYDFYLAEDALRDHALLAKYKVVVFALFRALDERRKSLVESLAKDGRTIVFLSETGVAGGAAVTGFDIAHSTNALPHVVVPEQGVSEEVASLMSADRRRIFPAGAQSIAKGPRTSVSEGTDVKVLARFASGGAPALALREEGGCRRVYVCEPAGLSAGMFNRLAREAGAYVPVSGGGLQVDMNGNFVSLHALRSGEWDFCLPFPCRVVNLASGRVEATDGGLVHLALTAGETCWLWFDIIGNR